MGAFHTLLFVLEDGVSDIANEQIMLLMTQRPKVIIVYRGIRSHASFIVVLETKVKYRGIRN